MLDHNFTTTCPNVKMTVITLKPFSTAVNPDFSDEKKLNEKKKIFLLSFKLEYSPNVT